MTLDINLAIKAMVVLMVLLFLGYVMTLLKDELNKMFKDSFTSAAGDYDPARLIGYTAVIFLVMVFLVLASYDTWAQGRLNYSGFTAACVAIAGLLTGAAAGVWIKRGTEVPINQPPAITPTQLEDVVTKALQGFTPARSTDDPPSQ